MRRQNLHAFRLLFSGVIIGSVLLPMIGCKGGDDEKITDPNYNAPVSKKTTPGGGQMKKGAGKAGDQ